MSLLGRSQMCAPLGTDLRTTPDGGVMASGWAGYRDQMSGYVMAMFVVQVFGGLYLLSFVAGAGQKRSSARATRLPDPVVLTHGGLGITATALWILYLLTGAQGLAWATFAALAVGASLGVFMFLKTARGAPVLEEPAGSRADVRVAEKQIPGIALAAHGTLAIALLVCTLLVALGVGVDG